MRFICFDKSLQASSVFVNHSFSKSVKHVPGGIHTTNSQFAPKLQCADPRCVGGHLVRCLEPLLKRNVGPMHEGARSCRDLTTTFPTLIEWSRTQKRSALARTFRTDKSFRPPTAKQIINARGLSRKLPTKVSYVFGVLGSAHFRTMPALDC